MRQSLSTSGFRVVVVANCVMVLCSAAQELIDGFMIVGRIRLPQPEMIIVRTMLPTAGMAFTT